MAKTGAEAAQAMCREAGCIFLKAWLVLCGCLSAAVVVMYLLLLVYWQQVLEQTKAVFPHIETWVDDALIVAKVWVGAGSVWSELVSKFS